MLKHPLYILLILLTLIGCSSTPETADSNSVLEPEDPPESPQVNPVQAPGYQRLMDQLAALGYEGMGLQFESEQTLIMLEQVFQDPSMAERRIRLVYTGLEMSYDPQYESITIGGLTQAEEIVNYIKKHVPLRNEPLAPEVTPAPTPTPAPVAAPTKPAVKKKAPARRATPKKPKK